MTRAPPRPVRGAVATGVWSVVARGWASSDLASMLGDSSPRASTVRESGSGHPCTNLAPDIRGHSGTFSDKCLLRRGFLRAFDRERLGDERGVLGVRGVVEVAHRGLDICVSHPLLNSADVGFGDHARAEFVAEVVEAEGPKTGGGEGVLVAPAQRGAVNAATADAGEDQVIVAGEQIAATERNRGRGVGRQRDRSHLARLRRRQRAAE